MASTSSDVKAKLMQNLKVIRTANYALKFISMLIEVQEMPNESRQQRKKLRRCKMNITDYNQQIVKDIKEILNCEPADELVKLILKVLNAPEETLCKEKQEFLNILSKGNSDNPAEYLYQLIRAVESLFEFFCCPGRYTWCSGLKKEFYEQKLRSLQKFLFSYGRYTTEKVFAGMFLLGINKYDFSWEEKKEIGDIVIEAMPYFKELVKKLCYNFECAFGVPSLQQRSSLQFIRELLADYSAEHVTLKDFIGCLDVIIKTQDKVAIWSYYTHLYDPSDDSSLLKDEDISIEYYEKLKKFNKAGASRVPKEHTWWQVYKKAFFH